MSISLRRIASVLLATACAWSAVGCAGIEESMALMQARIQTLAEETAEDTGISPKTHDREREADAQSLDEPELEPPATMPAPQETQQ